MKRANMPPDINYTTIQKIIKTPVKCLIPRRQLSNTCKQWNNTTQIHRRDSD